MTSVERRAEIPKNVRRISLSEFERFSWLRIWSPNAVIIES